MRDRNDFFMLRQNTSQNHECKDQANTLIPTSYLTGNKV